MNKRLLIMLLTLTLFLIPLGVVSAHSTHTTHINGCVGDLYAALADLGPHPSRADVDTVVEDYVACRNGNGITLSGSPFNFGFNNDDSFDRFGFNFGFNRFGTPFGFNRWFRFGVPSGFNRCPPDTVPVYSQVTGRIVSCTASSGGD